MKIRATYAYVVKVTLYMLKGYRIKKPVADIFVTINTKFSTRSKGACICNSFTAASSPCCRFPKYCKPSLLFLIVGYYYFYFHRFSYFSHSSALYNMQSGCPSVLSFTSLMKLLIRCHVLQPLLPNRRTYSHTCEIDDTTSHTFT